MSRTRRLETGWGVASLSEGAERGQVGLVGTCQAEGWEDGLAGDTCPTAP